MARVVFGTYMVRYPLGGALSSALQWLLALRALGHDVHVVEKSGWPDSCFDPSRNVMSDDCTYGFETVRRLLSRFELGNRLCYVDAGGVYHGMTREAVALAFSRADIFIDRGAHGAWEEEAAACSRRLLLDAEPGWRQIEMHNTQERGERLPEYDHFATVGANIGTPLSPAPTAGHVWKRHLPPVSTQLFTPVRLGVDGNVTTVMSWKAHRDVEYAGRTYGQKDVEFERFLDLPGRVEVPIEVAVGNGAPRELLREKGWLLRNAHEVTASVDSYQRYIAGSLAEFSVCKSVFVELNTGWFSDRTAAYLASGRPAVVQETGFSTHLPCGEGLFAVRTVDEAAAAIAEIAGDVVRHARAARSLACEYLDGRRVVGRLLDEVGVG
jgi:hypothetical protein